MCDKRLIILNSGKLYLTTFELFSGQYGQIFYKAFYAKNEKSLENQIHKYLKNYYDKGNNTGIEGKTYYYFDGEVAVKNHGWEEITELRELVNKLL
ncbi:MAG: hypothetical protein AB1638_07750 [Nitrospirota bacterium]